MSIPHSKNLISELTFTSSRSSGPGGQNVNKVNSKVTLKFDVMHSLVLTSEQKELITKKRSSQLSKEGVLSITAQDKRTQLQNKEEVLSKLDRLLTKIFTPKKPRKATKPSKAAKHLRIKEKKQRSEKKQWRQKV
ncbi:MAG: aminoacyl-tRNA hydrolase [Bacteroidia bacterium]|nr:aminoacyl-tRNA hydrolase [Bacteroidia bacterium]